MDRYTEGVLNTFDKVLKLMDLYDPENKLVEYKILRTTINAWISGYKAELEHLEKFKDVGKGYREYLQNQEYIISDATSITIQDYQLPEYTISEFVTSYTEDNKD